MKTMTIKQFATKMIIKYLQKNIIWRCWSYDELGRMGIEDIFTSELKYKLQDGEIAIVIKIK